MYVVNTSCFPFVGGIVWGDCTHDDLAAMKSANIANRSRGPHASLMDARRANMPDAKMRRAIADLMKGLEEQRTASVMCSGVVLGSTAAVGVLTALQWLSPPKQPLKYFSTAHDAWTWMRARAAENALVMPDSALSLVKRLDDIFERERDPSAFAE